MVSITIGKQLVTLDSKCPSSADKAAARPFFSTSEHRKTLFNWQHLSEGAWNSQSQGITTARGCTIEALVASLKLRSAGQATAEQAVKFLRSGKSEADSIASAAAALLQHKDASFVCCRSAAEIVAAAAELGPCVVSLRVGTTLFPLSKDGFASASPTTVGCLTFVAWAGDASHLLMRSTYGGDFFKVRTEQVNRDLEYALCFQIEMQPKIRDLVAAAAVDVAVKAILQPEVKATEVATPESVDEPSATDATAEQTETQINTPTELPSEPVAESSVNEGEPGTVKVPEPTTMDTATKPPQAEATKPQHDHRRKNRR